MIGDRRLDREVGEKVLDYQMYHYGKGASERSCYWCLVDAEWNPVGEIAAKGLPHRSTEAEAWQDLPQFSYDLAAAWQLVDHIRYSGFGFGIWSVGDLWVANFEHGIRQEYEADGETPAEAICRAALKVAAAGHFSAEGQDDA